MCTSWGNWGGAAEWGLSYDISSTIVQPGWATSPHARVLQFIRELNLQIGIDPDDPNHNLSYFDLSPYSIPPATRDLRLQTPSVSGAIVVT